MARDTASTWASNPQYQQRIQALLPQIRQVQQRYGLPDSAIPYMLANAGIESRWNTASADGSANDIGLLQVTPILAKDYNAPHTRDPQVQLDVLGQYYDRGLKRGLQLDSLATGWNTGMGRAAQVDSGQRSWDSVTGMAPRYNRAVNDFVNSASTKQLLGGMGINYNSTTRAPSVARTMQAFNISDRGPQTQALSQLPDLSAALTGIAPGQQPVAQQQAPVDMAARNIPMTDLQLDGILHTDLGLGERLF